ncbi:signal recognition particle subunit SRP68-like [Lingula anatina]|nr:signal recognition particle subunit SRP68-like [Lingula anatina]|eukprot:XP_013401526.2 signal recognition particle subunit SRP68-like [Lingula anatina]
MIDTLKQNLPGSATFDENKKVTKPQDLVRFYEIIIQNLSEIPNLPGVEEDASLGHEVEVETLAYKAFRCFYVAQTYAVGKKWPEALALYEKVEKYIQAALSGYKEMKGDQAKRFKDDLARLQSLEQQVNSAKYECQASSILNMGDLTDQMSAVSVRDIAKKPLIERLDEYVDDPGLRSKKPNLVSFPPDFQPVPCKPLYFDLALNHVEFPDLEHKLEQQKQQKKGITGMVSGWFSWGKK